MNTYKHALISVKHWGGCIDDYYPIHDFIDSTKALCSDSRHRILHTLWGIREIVVPVFGNTITNSDSKTVDVKDLCEKDHLLIDYHYRFIPTLSDFVELIDTSAIPNWTTTINTMHGLYAENPAVSKLLMSPLANTGKLASLLFTHNSWFINEILPLVMGTQPLLTEFAISPNDIFNNMDFELWLNNGSAPPPSAVKLQKTKVAV
ncbi:hypothetical protein H0A36_28375 [Endozoicomonas sp. SM1973]|uniref:DUF6915 domain-containing protein n=1 Tax=Spartinivicinus marinus TaxID=2994442 RepID=A0A853ILK1_9GAMM|nr:hypothetical protein [Spartinivicinus marinus]MCX4030357.1 hypothetical protein [Spartinivicinus marinus]NYZ69935.1 hypothetical protein [Spartinivicinus marinus]